jgi:hypothetical protein
MNWNVDYNNKTGLYKLTTYNQDGDVEAEFYDLGSIEEATNVLYDETGHAATEDEIADILLSANDEEEDDDFSDWAHASIKTFGDLDGFDSDEDDY